MLNVPIERFNSKVIIHLLYDLNWLGIKLPLPTFLFSTFPFWSLKLCRRLGSICCSSLTSDHSSSSSLSIFATVVLVTPPPDPLVCGGLEENEFLDGAWPDWTGLALIWVRFILGCGDLPLCVFLGGSSSMSVSSPSDSASELKGGVLNDHRNKLLSCIKY